MTAALFLVKDGTLIEDLPDNVDPARMRLTHGMAPLLLHARYGGFALFVVSTQSGAARDRFEERGLAAVAQRLIALVAAAGGRRDGCYSCPHLATDVVPPLAIEYACRLPRPGLLLRAAREHGIDLSAWWMLGDLLDVVEAGNRAGCRTLLRDASHETEWRAARWRLPDGVVRTPAAAIPWLTRPPAASLRA